VYKKRYNILKCNPHPGHTYIDDDVVMTGWKWNDMTDVLTYSAVVVFSTL